MRLFTFTAFIFTLTHLATAQACDVYTGPAAIIGGQGPAPYAAFIEQDGSVQTLEGLPPTGLTYRVGINSHGYGIVGGTNGVDAYAALVSPEGKLTSVPGLIAPGEIYFVSINEAGQGMIGGGHQVSNIPYAAFVSQDGTATPYALPASGLIYGVAIEKAGNGIIGGIGPLDSAYAALTLPDGSLTPLTGLPTQGAIFWVSANGSGTKLIGGKDQTDVYAAFVSPQGVVSAIPDLPPGVLFSVAINDSGLGLIGGESSTLPYAALVQPDGTATTIPGLPTGTGKIYNVALNRSNTGLLAGFSNTVPYAFFVTPQGTLRPISGLPSGPGFVDGAALHDSGVAIIGGTSGNRPFLAVVAPNGTPTFLDNLPAEGEINSIAIAAFEHLVPRTIGPYESLANTQFLLSGTLTQHNLFHRGCCCCEGSSLWLAPFGNDVRQKNRQTIPTYTNHIAGALLGFDYCWEPDVVIGAGLAYAFNDVHYSRHLGHARINNVSGVVYASFDKPDFYLNVALWGGGFQVSNKRHSFASITSRNKNDGWTLSPHVEVSKSFALTPCQCYAVEPYFMLDCANHWQSRYRERGDSGFNVRLKEHCISILRNEIGVRFYESFEHDWGCLVLEEKIGYVNRTPLSKKIRKAAFEEAFDTFDVRTFSSSGQNNGVISFHLECSPFNLGSIYASIDYQGEFGSSFTSNSLSASIGKNF